MGPRAIALAAELWISPPADHADGVMWDAPDSCPTRADVVAKIVELSPDVGAAKLVARGSITPADTGMVLDAVVETPSGTTTRRIEAPDCGALADAFALLVSVAAVPDVPVDPRPVVAPPTLRPIDPPASRPNDRRARRRVPAPGGLFRIAPFLELGIAPGASGGPFVAGGLAWRRLLAEIGASYAAPRRRDYGPPGGGIDIHVVTSHVRICPALVWRRGDAWLCALFDVGAIIARGHGVLRPRTVAAPWIAGGLGPGGSIRLRGPVHLFLEVQAVVAATRPAFELADSMGLYRAGIVAGRLLLGLQLRWPAQSRRNAPGRATSSGSSAQ